MFKGNIKYPRQINVWLRFSTGRKKTRNIEVTHLPRIYKFLSDLSGILSSWHKLELSRKREPQLIKCFHNITHKQVYRTFSWLMQKVPGHCCGSGASCCSWASGSELYKKEGWDGYGGKASKQHSSMVSSLVLAPRFLTQVLTPTSLHE